ncbi:MAG: heme A synthase [Actinobacteria bacterium]|nr:MAG: heme A synthase [Actinomycetota bacterium]
MSEHAVLTRATPPRAPVRPSGLVRGLAIAATAATFLLVAIGALVRATDSGLGCPGWPKCFGRWLPPFRYHAVIEYSHRLTAFLDIVLIGVLAVVVVARYRGVRRVFVPSIAAAVLVVFQAILGAIVVEGNLHALLVTAHFMTAMILAGALTLATVGVFDPPSGPAERANRLARMAGVATALAFVLLAVGTYVRGEGASLAFPDWPLMNGRVVPHLGALRPALQFSHRALAAGVFVAVVVLAAGAWSERRSFAAVAALALTAAGLFVAQILVGAVNVWSRLSPAAVTAHVALAPLIWGALVATTVVARRSGEVR